MEKYEIEKLRDLPIEEVASQLGLQVARHKSLCPFHSDHHASLSFNTRKNLCRCFVCMDESLDSIGLVMKSLHVDFPKACFWLAERNGILLEKAGEGMAGGGIAAHLLLLRPYLLHLQLLRPYLLHLRLLRLLRLYLLHLRLLRLYLLLQLHPTLLMRHDMRDSSNIRG